MALEYEPLEPSLREIRLLTLLPASNTLDDAIVANLQKFSLNRQPVFEALSYVWGDENDTKPIKVNGKTVQITRNLEAALRQLRRSEPLVLWVDALCIDQKNTKEKGFQLPLMCELYTRSQQVIIWLGEGNRYIEALFQWANSTRASEAASIETPPSAIPPAQNESAMAWIGYIDLFLLPYWNRMWTYQEMVLPDNDPVCVYGSHSSPLSVITAHEIFPELVQMTDPHSIFTELATLDLSKYEDSIRQKLPFGVDAPVIREIRTGIKAARSPPIRKNLNKFHMLLRSTVGRKSHDPRDRFYALYGLCTQAQSLCPADYAESNCMDKVLVKAAVFIAEFETGPCIMIAEFGMRASRFSDLTLPSWVPDFNTIPNLHAKEPLCAESLRRRLASNPMPANRCRDAGILIQDPGVVSLEKDISISVPAYLDNFKREVEDMLERVSPDESSSLILDPHNGMFAILPDSVLVDEVVLINSLYPALVHDINSPTAHQVFQSYLGDIPTLQIAARRIGECCFAFPFEQSLQENAMMLASFLLLLPSFGYPNSYGLQMLIQVYELQRRPGSPDVPSLDDLQTAYEAVAMSASSINATEFQDLITRLVRKECSPLKEQTDKERLCHMFAKFLIDCATRLTGLSFFGVDIEGICCVGIGDELIEKGDLLVVPVSSEGVPLMLRRDTIGDFHQAGTASGVQQAYGDKGGIVYYQMVGPAFMHELAKETELVARLAERIAEDFFIR